MLIPNRMKPPRGYESLRQQRTSIPGASYFVTACTRDRQPGLHHSEPAAAIRAELSAMNHDRTSEPRAWVVMPDHLHLLIRLNDKLTLGQAIGRFKAKTRQAVLARGLAWQGNYFEHRLRPDDQVEEVLRYIYLNPYHTKLVSHSESYPHFWMCETDAAWFSPMLDDERPFPEWLREP